MTNCWQGGNGERLEFPERGRRSGTGRRGFGCGPRVVQTAPVAGWAGSRSGDRHRGVALARTTPSFRRAHRGAQQPPTFPHTGVTALSAPTSGHRHRASDRSHRGADDGESLLRQQARHAGSAWCRRLQASPRCPGRGQPVSQRRPAARVPHAYDLPAFGSTQPGMGRQSYPVRRRPQRRFREVAERPGLDGLLGRRRPALLLFAGQRVPDRGPILLLRAGADLSQPAVPHLRHVDRPGGRHPPERKRLSGERHHL